MRNYIKSLFQACIVLSDDNLDNEKIRMNGVVRQNLCVKLGDIVRLVGSESSRYI